MHLQNFDIERIVERFRDAPDKAASRLTPRLILPDLTITALLAASLIFTSSAALSRWCQDMRLAGLGRERGEGNGGNRRGEINNAVSLCQQRRGIAGQLNAVLRRPARSPAS